MSRDLSPNDESLTRPARERIDRICLEFEDDLKAGQRPRIEQYLGDAPEPERSGLLRELLLLEWYYRCRGGESVDPAEYRARFADRPGVLAEVLGELKTCPRCRKQLLRSETRCAHCGAAFPAPILGSEHATGKAIAADTALPAQSDFRFSPASAQASTTHGRFLPGSLVAGRYRIVCLVGRGGMGEVYRADDLRLGQRVALKFLPQSLAGDPQRLEYMHNEVRLARQVSHPNVCRVYDIGEADGDHFLSMEFVDGEDLASLLRRIGRLPPDRGLLIARQLAAGLAAAHHVGILHRDLKPGNVMIDDRGQVRITDFGLACLSEAAGQAPLRAGTPAYMSPEQLAGEPLTVQSDVYSLGLVLYELVTGSPPFSADSLEELTRIRRQSSPVAPSRLVEGLDPAVERVILHCLRAKPAERPSSADTVLAALPGKDPLQQALAAGETPSPEMVAAAEGSGRVSRDFAAVCLAGILLGLLAVVFLAGKTTLVGQVALTDPRILAHRAEEIVQDQGYGEQPRDRAFGFAYERGPPPAAPVSFWYRQSPSELVPERFAGSFVATGNGAVSLDDPPPPIPGEASVRLDPQGRLIEFRADPSLLESTASQGPRSGGRGPDAEFPTWSLSLLRWAELDGKRDGGIGAARFTAVQPTRPAPTYCDAQETWQGVCKGVSLTVDAAAWGGRPVYFRVAPSEGEVRPSTSRQPPPAAYGVVKVVLFLFFVAAAVLLARQNLRRGRSDPKRAFRLALYLFVVYTISWLLLTGRAARLPQWSVFVMGLEIAVFISVVLGLFYLALEPYVRRIWPETLISWNRLLAGRFRDPLVGRDLLLGAVVGVGTKLLWQLNALAPSWLGLGPPDLFGPQRAQFGVPLHLLLAARYSAGEFFHFQVSALAGGLTVLMFLLLLQLMLRKRWLAAAAYVLYGAFVWPMGIGHPYVSWFAGGLSAALVVLLLTRFGLLALVSYTFVRLMLTYPITHDLSAWHAGCTTLFPLAVILALSAYGFWSSLAGRPLLRDAIPQG